LSKQLLESVAAALRSYNQAAALDGNADLCAWPQVQNV
jgi:hypothetical protein